MVVGGGIMGTGIAYSFLQAGLPVTIIEANERSVQKAIKSGESLTQKSVAQGHISADQAKEMYDSLEVTSNYNAAKKADLAIEAVSEDIELKINVFRKLETVMAKDAILATNTSYLDINQIADALNNPRRLIGLHFFVPAHIMKLLEIIRGHQSSKKALATGYVVAKVLKKTPVLSGVCEGFIGNRILSSQREAADTLLLTGSTPSEVDKAMENFGYKIGPYKAQDMSGLDIAFCKPSAKR